MTVVWEWETSVMLIRDQHERVLLVHQSYGLQLFGLPGGKVENGETPRQAAVREVMEETGLTVTIAGLFSIEDLVYPGTGQRYRAFTYTCASMSGELSAQVPSEISSVGWYELGRLPSPLTPSASAVFSRLAGFDPTLA